MRGSEFARLRRRGRRAQGTHVTVVAAPSPPGERARLAVVTTKGFANAVERNRARRRLRAAFAGLEEPPTGLDLILTARISARSIAYTLLCEDLRATLGRL
ncbi:MAG TPA: ribonuclease P protein component [Candidatus Baltobacteraceae bacterium]